MLRIHKTKEGDRLFISQMDDTHLVNTISLIMKRICKCKNALSSKISISSFKAALYKVDTNSLVESAKERIAEETNILYPYISEAMLRGMSFTKELQELFERTGQEVRFGIEADSDDDFLLEYEEEV